MRYTPASISVMFALTPSLPNLRRLNILKVASNKTIRLREYEWRCGQDGMSEKLMNLMKKCYLEYCKKHNIPLNQKPYFLLMLDEMYVQRGVVYSPKSNEIRGFAKDFGHDTIHNVCDIIFGKYEPEYTHLVLQTLFVDLRSGFEFDGPWLGSEAGLDCAKLFSFLYDDIVENMWLHLNWRVFGFVSDMNAYNQELVRHLMVRDKFAQVTSNDHGSYVLRFSSSEGDHDMFFFFEPPHLLKNLRNAFEKSKENMLIVSNKKQRVSLQHSGRKIVWDVLERASKYNISCALASPTSLPHFTKLSEKCVFLGCWTKQRVNLAYYIFCGNTLSGLRAIPVATLDPHSVGTINFIQLVHDLFVGRFVIPSLGKSKAKIKSMDDAFWQENENQIDKFSRWKKSSNSVFLDDKIWFGMRALVSTFKACASQFFEMNEKDNVECYFCPFRITTSKLELTFGSNRQLKGDLPGRYDKAGATLRHSRQIMLNSNLNVTK